MDKSILFLGTSHGEPSRTRFCSSALYTFGNNKLLVDAGEPVAALLVRLGINPSDIGGCIITHFHGDHVNGLFQLVYQMGRYPVEGVFPTICFPEECNIPPFLSWREATYSQTPLDTLTLRAFPPEGTPLYMKDNKLSDEPSDGAVKITSINGRHLWRMNARAQAFLMEYNGIRIVHTGDLCEELDDFPLKPGDEPCDVCVCEGTHFYWELEKAIEVLRHVPVRRMIFNHVSPYWTDGNEYKLMQLTADLPYPVDIARDGEFFALDKLV